MQFARIYRMSFPNPLSSITFKCEIITPMFLAGADGRTPELRAASIKGALRFWWRALHGNLTLEKLLEKENEIFGGTRKGEGRSNIIVRTKKVEALQVEEYSPIPHHDNEALYENNFFLPAFMDGGKFEVQIFFIEANKELILYLMLIFSFLGGLGKRSRRGFGSFLIEKAIYKGENILPVIKDTRDILTSIEKINSNIIDNGRLLNNFYENHFPYLEEINIGDKFSRFYPILRNIGVSSHKNSFWFKQNVENGSRLASPIYVSIIWKTDGFYPVFTRLHTEIPPRKKDND